MSNEHQLIALGAFECEPNPWNRKAEPDADMIASIAQHGVLVPIIVRPHPKPHGDVKYQIIAGERRWKAKVKAKTITPIPARFMDVDDQIAQEISFIENWHRTNPTAWEQAEAIQRLLEKWDAKSIASNLGLSVQVVRRRAQLLKLTPKWKKAMGTEEFRTWTPSHFERIAARPPAVQDDLLENEFDFNTEEVTLERLDEILANRMHDLKAAPWDCANATLVPKAGSCNECPKRTGANADLFNEVSGKTKAGDRCLDGACWDEKKAAQLEIVRAELKEKHGKLVELTERGHFEHPKDAVSIDDVQIVKEGSKGALPAVFVDGENEGKTVFCKPKPGEQIKEKGIKKSVAERREALEKRRRVHVLIHLASHLQGILKAKPYPNPYPKDLGKLVTLAAAFGTSERADTLWASGNPWVTVENAKGAKGVEELWRQVREVLGERCRSAAGQSKIGKAEWAEAENVCDLLGLKLSELVAAAVEEIKTPKTLQ